MSHELQDGTTYLRLERRGERLFASSSQDGVTWSSFPPLEIRFPDELKLGVTAVNTSTRPFAAELEGLGIFTRPDAQPQGKYESTGKDLVRGVVPGAKASS